MTQIGGPIPILRPLTGTITPFVLELHHFEPRALTPIGDRYLVETIPVNDDVQFGRFLASVRNPHVDPRNPMSDPNAEMRGVLPAVIISAGDGHLLGIPDHAVPVSHESPSSTNRDGSMNMAAHTNVERVRADVPMFCKPGDVVLVDLQFKGRALKIVGREVRIVNQMDVLLKLPLRLQWTDEGWKREGEAEAAAE